MSNIPPSADVVIIGGGVIGCLIAYHLTKLGITDVALLERLQLTYGTTGHAGGLVPQFRSTRTLTELAKYTSELLKTLEAETDQATGFKQNGSATVALTEARFEEFKRNVAMSLACRVDVDFLTPSDIKDRYPLLDGKDVVGKLWTTNDGQTNPVDTTQACAKGAKQRGVRIFENAKVTDIVVENGHVLSVKLNHHGVESKLPTDFGHFESMLTKTVKYVPVLALTGIATLFNDSESFTPDDLPIIEVHRMQPCYGTYHYLRERTRESRAFSIQCIGRSGNLNLRAVCISHLFKTSCLDRVYAWAN